MTRTGDDLPITATVVIPGAELPWTAERVGASMKVEVRFAPRATRVLDASAITRLLRTCANRLDGSGNIVITCQESDSQSRNLALAREQLAELVRDVLFEDPRNRKANPTRAVKAARERPRLQLPGKKRRL
jgi:protein subunit release factor B